MREQMTMEQIKQSLAKKMGMSADDSNLEWDWQTLLEGMHPQAVIDGHLSLGDYLREALNYLAWDKAGKSVKALLRKPRAEEQPSEPFLREEERMRAEVFSRLCAARAGLSRPVMEWRQRYTNGRVLPSEEAVRFLRSPDNGFLLCLEETDQEVEATRLHRDGAVKLYHPKGEGWCMILVHPLNSLGQLSKLGHDLSETWGWPEELSAWFVISGEIPYIPPLAARVMQTIPNGIPRCTVTLEIEPWVSGRSLLAAYRALQVDLLGQDNHGLGMAALSAVHAAISWDDGKIILGSRSPRNVWPRIFQLWRSIYSSRFSYPDAVRLSKVVAETLKRFLSPHWLKIKAPSR